MGLGGIGVSLLFVLLFLSFPLSFSLFYKLVRGVCIYACRFGIFLSWVVYRISEQFYLFSFLLGVRVPRGDAGMLCFV